MDLREYKTDPFLEEEGKDVVVDDTTTIKIARFNNPKFRQMQARLSEPYQKAVGRGNISDENAGKILSKCMAAHIIKGWSGLMLDGKEVPYSSDKALEIMLDPTLKEFKEQVLQESQRIDNFREERLEEDLKNSPPPSSTAPAGRKKSKSSSKT